MKREAMLCHDPAAEATAGAVQDTGYSAKRQLQRAGVALSSLRIQRGKPHASFWVQ